jgi:hypothetical protein
MLSDKHMPKKSKGHKRSTDVTTKEIGESTESPGGKSQAAVQLGRMGGQARAKKLGGKRRREIARKAAAARWKK